MNHSPKPQAGRLVMRRRDFTRGVGAALVTVVVTACGVLLIPLEIVRRIGTWIDHLIRNPNIGTADVRRELQTVRATLRRYRRQDGSVVIPSDELDDLNEELEEIKEKHRILEEGIEELERRIRNARTAPRRRGRRRPRRVS